jgi:uncharacterized protein (DUF1810 family)
MNESKFALFVSAQDEVYRAVLAELSSGRKATHWMWFIFPQLAGLGVSSMAQKFSIASLDEARAYLAHPTLGARLLECTKLLLSLPEVNVTRVLGSPDDVKFRSCMTLFSIADPAAPVFHTALTKYFDGVPDSRTISLLERHAT